MAGEVHPGLQGCETGSADTPGGEPTSPWGVPGAERAPALPKLPDDLKQKKLKIKQKF